MNGVEISLNTIIVRKNDLPTADIDGEIGMMHIEKGQYYSLDAVGTRIWDLLEKPQAIKDVIPTLQEEYEVDDETCQAHVLELIGELYRADLVSIV